MTLEEKAEEYAKKECCTTCKNINHSCKEKCECWTFAVKGYLAGVRELEQENNKLLDVINNQDVKIADLEKQIEKMKCCGNCKGVCNSDDVAYFCKNNGYKLWEIKEND